MPSSLCTDTIIGGKVLNDEFGCSAILCPPGTFHPDGSASIVGGCQPCPKTDLAEEFEPKLSTVLGRASCESNRFLIGDQNVDGDVSQREALRLMYYEMNGNGWGEKFGTWREPKVDECELAGITCNGCGEVSKIDLSEANLCLDSNSTSPKTEVDCGGIPAQIKYFNASLEAFIAPNRPFLTGNIPSEFGALTELKILDLHGCPMLGGSIPSELGQLSTKLQQLDLSGTSINGTLPNEMFDMLMLEKIDLSMTRLTGSLPSEIGYLRRLKELRISRTQLNGTLPSTMGELRSIENLEIYSNSFSGSLPSKLQKLTALKRIGACFTNVGPSYSPTGLANILSSLLYSLQRCLQ